MRIRKVNLEVLAIIIENLVAIDRNVLRLRKTKTKTNTKDLASIEEHVLLGRVQVIPQVMKDLLQVWNRPEFSLWQIERRRNMKYF